MLYRDMREAFQANEDRGPVLKIVMVEKRGVNGSGS